MSTRLQIKRVQHSRVLPTSPGPRAGLTTHKDALELAKLHELIPAIRVSNAPLFGSQTLVYVSRHACLDSQLLPPLPQTACML
eukprot:4603965-Amphidinium_carterae.1